MTLLGYARVSTDEQDTAAQASALKSAGCSRVFQEKASGGRWDRPELHRILDHLREGDVLVVWKLDRLSRSSKDLIHILEQIEARGARFMSLTEAIDTTSAAGRMLAQMLGAFAEFERSMTRERTMAGLKAAKARGRKGGRPKKLTAEQEDEILDALRTGRKAPATLARLYNVHRSTISRLEAQARVAPRPPRPPRQVDIEEAIAESAAG